MSFSEILKSASSRVEGSVGALIFASDGIFVDAYLTENSIDTQALSAELSLIIKNITAAFRNLELGDIDEFFMTSNTYKLLLKKISPDYYMVMLLKPEGNIGKGRFIMKITAPVIEKEI